MGQSSLKFSIKATTLSRRFCTCVQKLAVQSFSKDLDFVLVAFDANNHNRNNNNSNNNDNNDNNNNNNNNNKV